MLVIRDAQMKVLARAVRRSFEGRLIRHLSETRGLPEERLEAELPATIQTAMDLGFVRECDVARFCEAMYRYAGGPGIEGLPKVAQNILLAYGVEAAEKLDRLDRWAAADPPETYIHVRNV